MSFNPFEAGRGLSTKVRKSFLPMKGLNPFGTGRGLSTPTIDIWMNFIDCFNPFGAGRGLSTAGVVWCLDG